MGKSTSSPVLVSLICPIKDEAQNIPRLFRTLCKVMGPTEVWLVEGGSSDSSWTAAQKLSGKRNRFGVRFHACKQQGRGKVGAVITGFNKAVGKYLLIVDADLSIRPKDLTRIINLFQKHGDQVLVSGNRLDGWRKPAAFYWINYVGNYFFRYYYSLILKTPILDIACGSKGMTKVGWHKLRALQLHEGVLDKWGDIDWLYYGKRIGLTPRFVSVKYQPRLFDESKLQNVVTRWKFAMGMVTIGFKIFLNSHRQNRI